jgi:hypothetical protein
MLRLQGRRRAIWVIWPLCVNVTDRAQLPAGPSHTFAICHANLEADLVSLRWVKAQRADARGSTP